MAFVTTAGIRENWIGSGTGTVALGGAATGFSACSSAMANGDTSNFLITDGTLWEASLCTYSSSTNSLTRTSVLANSSGTTSPIAFGSTNAKAVVLTGSTVGGATLSASTMPIITGTIYVATTGGDDTRTLAQAASSATPWKTLGRVNLCAVAPGATILLNAGDTFTQAFLPMGGGTAGHPVTLSRYGTGAKPAIRPATVLPSTGWTTVRANVYSIAAPKPVGLPFPSQCVFEDALPLNSQATAAAVAFAEQCNWTAGVLTVFPTGGISPNTGTHIYRVCATNTAGADPTYGGSVGVETRWDYLTIDNVDVAWTGHANIGQGYNTDRHNIGTLITNCTCATTCYANIVFYCDNTGISGPHISNNAITSGFDGGILCIDANVNLIKHVVVDGNTLLGNVGGADGIAIGGSADSITISNNTLTYCAVGVGAKSAIGLGSEVKPTNIAVTGNMFIGKASETHVVIEAAGKSFGAGCSFTGNKMVAGGYGFSQNGDTSGSSTTGFLIERNEISDVRADGIALGSNVTGTKVHANLLTGCGVSGGFGNGINVSSSAHGVEIYNNTIDRCEVGLTIASSGTGSGSHNLANNTVTSSVAQDFLIGDATQLAQSQHNNAFGGGTPGYNGAYTGLAAWQAAGFEQGSLSVNPGFVGPTVTSPGSGVLATAAGYALGPTSPLIIAGQNVGLSTDFFGTAYRSVPSIGFYSVPTFSVSARAGASVGWSASLAARAVPVPLSLMAGRARSAPATIEVLGRAAAGPPVPLGLGGAAFQGSAGQIAWSGPQLGATAVPIEYLSGAWRGAPAPIEWRQTALQPAGRASLPLEWRSDQSVGLPVPVEQGAMSRGIAGTGTEWGLATISPSTVTVAPIMLEWRSGQSGTATAPVEALAGRAVAIQSLPAWHGSARASVSMPFDFGTARRGAASLGPLAFGSSVWAASPGVPIEFRVGITGSALVPIAWDGHLVVTANVTAGIEWGATMAGASAPVPLERLGQVPALRAILTDWLLTLGGTAVQLPTEIGAAPFVAPVIAPKLRTGLYGRAMQGRTGRYMLGGVTARLLADPVLVRLGAVISEGSGTATNRSRASVSHVGDLSGAGSLGAVNQGAGGSRLGPITGRASVEIILPNLAAGTARLAPLIGLGTVVLLPPDLAAGVSLMGSPVTVGAAVTVNPAAGIARVGQAASAGQVVPVPPDLVAGLALVGQFVTAGLGEQQNTVVATLQEGPMQLSGSLASLNAMSGTLQIDTTAPIVGGGTAGFIIASGGVSLATFTFTDLGGGSAQNPAQGTARLAPIAGTGTMVLTAYNGLTGTVQVGPIVAGATLFTEALTITSATAAQGIPIALVGTYTGGPPVALSSSFDGVTWTPLGSLSIGAGAWQGTAPALGAAGSASIQVRDANHTGVSATLSFTVASSAPAAPTSLVSAGGATASASMHGFYAADPDENGNAPAGRVLTVGPGGGYQYATVAAAIAASLDGDTIQVAAGTYTDDTATIRTSITLTALGGRVVMHAPTDLANTKGILIIGTATLSPTVTINGFDFTGAHVSSSANGAGIRHQNGFLTCTNCYFHDNEDGILGDPGTTGSIFIDHCEFAHNGNGNSLTHNMYIGAIPQFTLQNSYSHDAVAGHEVKTRALNSTITNNRIFNNTGSASYCIDVPQGGNATISGNIIEKGLNATNTRFIAYGEEAVTHNPGLTLIVSGNTFVNDLSSSSPSISAVWNLSGASGATTALSNNKFWNMSTTQITSGSTAPSTQVGSTFLTTRPTLDTTTLAYSTNFSVVAAHSAVFETRRIAHAAATSDAPVYANVAVNAQHDWSAWVSDMNYLALSWAADSHAAAMTPVLAVPLCLASDIGNPVPAYQAIVAGTHDAVFTGLIQAWQSNGFTTLYVRIAPGHNTGTQPWDVGTDTTQAGQWIAAFQHVVGLLRAVTGITVKIVWNPALSGARPLTVDQTYPGDAFVDVIGLSVFNGVTQTDDYSWANNDGSFEPDFATFMSKEANRAHYWSWPSATQANPNGVTGDGSIGLGVLVSLAQQHGKPICIPASGVGNLGDPTDAKVPLQGVWDDAAFPAALGTALFGAGVPPCLFINAWDLSTTAGDWTFSDPSYTGSMAKPNATAAWAALFAGSHAVSDSIGLSWTAPVATVAAYQVQYKLSSVGSWTAAPSPGATPNTTLHGLANGTTYDFRVSASNVSGTGPFVTITGVAVP